MSTDDPIKYHPDGKLIEDRRWDINPDPRYWDWFDAWWAQDFSWDGLAKRKIKGWDDGRSLQDYWREEEDRLIAFGGRTWTRFHLPPHDRSGEEKSEKRGLYGFEENTWHRTEWHNWRNAILQKLEEASTYYGSGKDTRAQLTGICFPNYFELSSVPPDSLTMETGSIITLKIRADWSLFGLGVSFQYIKFMPYTNFVNAQFGNDADFASTQFSKHANFANAQFGNNAIFAMVQLENYASFFDVQFKGHTNFSNAQFGDKANFAEAQFGGRAMFTKAQFVGRAKFKKVQFGDFVDFKKAQFGDWVDFTETQFKYWAVFTETQFGDLTKFSKAIFRGESFFSGNPSIAVKEAQQYVNGLYFTGTIFHKRADFSDRVFPKNTTFADAHFYQLAKFHGCAFHQDTSFADAIFETPNKNLGLMEDFWLSRAGYVDETLDPYQRAFQTLRLHMDKLRQFGQEMKFAKLEMQARERRFGSKDTPFWVRTLSRAYGLFADYGQSALRPLLWLAGFYVLAACLYALVGGGLGHWKAALAVAFRYALPPLTTFAGQFFAGEVDPVFVNALLDHPFLTRLVMTLHALLSAVMVFFVLLALKRRFQIR